MKFRMLFCLKFSVLTIFVLFVVGISTLFEQIHAGICYRDVLNFYDATCGGSGDMGGSANIITPDEASCEASCHPAYCEYLGPFVIQSRSYLCSGYTW